MNEGRTGWLGGTFDPIHNGHLDVAAAARKALSLDTVFLVPANVPPHRHTPTASPEHRLAMVTLAAAELPWLRVSDIELSVSKPSYTMDTLDRLEDQGMSLSSLFVITGADAFADILSWKAPIALLNRCHFIVVSRPGMAAPILRERLPELAERMIDSGARELPAQPGIFLVDAPTAPVSATEVRARAARKSSLEGMVPEAVASYISRNGLYA